MNVKVLAGLIVIVVVGISGYFLLKGEEREERIYAPAEFEVLDFTFYPSEVEAGDQVTVSATVRNVGDLSGTYTATLKVNGAAEATENVIMAGGTTETVSFTITKNNIG
ncbi:MAG: hypothetical protein MUO36_01460, partial [Candidatus Hadarchaeum sp.]|nr:hypothetical protein [Candidatus Hadarchaeum sp.]